MRSRVAKIPRESSKNISSESEPGRIAGGGRGRLYIGGIQCDFTDSQLRRNGSSTSLAKRLVPECRADSGALGLFEGRATLS